MFAPRQGQSAQKIGDLISPQTAHTTNILGVDPGLTRCGYAILRVVGKTDVSVVSLGVLRTKPECDLPGRLAEIGREIDDLLDEFKPSALAIERIFFQSNVRTAMSVGQVSGVVMSAASRHGVEVVQYSPSEVKLAVAGWGGADKAQVQKMVKQRLKLNSIPKPADAADAAAIALCHIASSPFTNTLVESSRSKK